MVRSGQAAPLARPGEIRMPAQAASEPMRAVRRVEVALHQGLLTFKPHDMLPKTGQRPHPELDCFRFANNNCAAPSRKKWSGYMDKLRAIKFFCSVAEAKSFVAAAHNLDVRPSVLSKVIASLERDIDFRLFNRTTRRVSLTENGAQYYDRCKRLVADLEQAEVLTRDADARPVGKLLAGLHPALNRTLMAASTVSSPTFPTFSLRPRCRAAPRR
jgi:hypothetical protein